MVAHQLDISLDRNSPAPLYRQLAQAIEQAISVGDLAPGDRLENEMELTSRLGLSRPTARQAIQVLVQKGLLVRKRGVGTQVVRSHFRRDGRLSSLNEDLTKAGRTPTTQLLHFSIGDLANEIREGLDAVDVVGQEFLKIRRLRFADQEPLAILTNYLPSHFGVNESDLMASGLYACLDELGVHVKVAHQRVSARLMNEEESTLFAQTQPVACLAVDRLVYDDVGQFVEYGRHVYRADRYSLQSSLEV